MTSRAVLWLMAALLAAACGRQELPPPDATYEVRGQVLQLPAGRGGELTVHHETVADFRDRQGEPSPMESMSMPFAVAPAVSLADVAPGDKVEMTFEVRWRHMPTLRVVALRELPAETTFELSGPKLELVAPLGSSTVPAASLTASPSPAPATDGPVSAPGETL